MMLDAILVRRLQYVRLKLIQAEQELSNSTRVAAASALVSFQDAVEGLLVAVADAVGVDQKSWQRHVMELVSAIESKSLGRPVPLHTTLRRLIELRNQTKHWGHFPDLLTTREVVRPIRGWCEDVARSFLVVDLWRASLGALIADPDIADDVQNAEWCIGQKDYHSAFIYLARAFRVLANDGVPDGLHIDDHQRRLSFSSFAAIRSTRHGSFWNANWRSSRITMRSPTGSTFHSSESIPERTDRLLPCAPRSLSQTLESHRST